MFWTFYDEKCYFFNYHFYDFLFWMNGERVLMSGSILRI